MKGNKKKCMLKVEKCVKLTKKLNEWHCNAIN